MKTWLALIALSAAAFSQGGYTTEKFPELGLELRRARDFEQLPLQPGEEWLLLKYRERESLSERRERQAPPSFWIVQIEGTTEAPPETTRSDKTDDDEERPIYTLASFVDQRLGDWTLSAPEEGRERDGYAGGIHQLSRSKNPLRGYVYAYTRERPTPRTVALFGWCHERDYDEFAKIWKYTAESMRFDEAEDLDVEQLERYYERRKFRDAEHRIAVRAQLIKGWDAEDTDNFILVFDTPDQPLVRRVLREVEALRKTYLELFPPAFEMTAVSTVRVCKSREEYMFYGGPPSSAGYWNSRAEELVLYDAAVQDGARSIDTDTFIVLYHEAFHQYIYYSAGELAPHSWFNEGYGDYFGGARISGGKVVKIGTNPWRRRAIQQYIARNQHVSWKDIIEYDQKTFYANARVCYPQAWSMIYFLQESKEVAKHASWSTILETYFETLKRAWQTELQRIESKGLERTELVMDDARSFSRAQAVKAAFADVDLFELEQAWLDFTLELKED